MDEAKVSARLISKMIAEELRLDCYREVDAPGLEFGDLYTVETRKRLALFRWTFQELEPHKHSDQRLVRFEFRAGGRLTVNIPVTSFVAFADVARGFRVPVRAAPGGRKEAEVFRLRAEQARSFVLVMAQAFRLDLIRGGA